MALISILTAGEFHQHLIICTTAPRQSKIVLLARYNLSQGPRKVRLGRPRTRKAAICRPQCHLPHRHIIGFGSWADAFIEIYKNPEVQARFEVAQTYMVGGVILDLIMGDLVITTFILLVRKHYKFRLVFLCTFAYAFLYPWLNNAWLYFFGIHSSLPPIDQEALGMWFSQQLWFIVWTIYIYSSKRVVNTFGY